MRAFQITAQRSITVINEIRNIIYQKDVDVALVQELYQT